jgi:hypothetical protein
MLIDMSEILSITVSSRSLICLHHVKHGPSTYPAASVCSNIDHETRPRWTTSGPLSCGFLVGLFWRIGETCHGGLFVTRSRYPSESSVNDLDRNIHRDADRETDCASQLRVSPPFPEYSMPPSAECRARQHYGYDHRESDSSRKDPLLSPR